MYTLKKERKKNIERRRARVTDVFYANKKKKKKRNQMTRIISGRNLWFIYIYMFLSQTS
jgi:hypothetical protein